MYDTLNLIQCFSQRLLSLSPNLHHRNHNSVGLHQIFTPESAVGSVAQLSLLLNTAVAVAVHCDLREKR